MKYAIIIGQNGGYQTHTGNIDNLDLPEGAEIYEDRGDFERRLNELRE